MVDFFLNTFGLFIYEFKSASSFFSAIKTIFNQFCPIFIHTDIGTEFCNDSMYNMLSDYNVRHVRGRARSPWRQGQVENSNQTIKWMIGSMLMSTDQPGKWMRVREDATNAYISVRYSTPHYSPFRLFFGQPI